jgi:hypothetical protein
VDFLWRDQRLVGEFDGKVKYGRLLKPGQSVSDVVYDEKVREDRIRDEDLGVVRWTGQTSVNGGCSGTASAAPLIAAESLRGRYPDCAAEATAAGSA